MKGLISHLISADFRIVTISIATLMLINLSACNLPFVPDDSQSTTTTLPAIPQDVLTEVAATIQFQLTEVGGFLPRTEIPPDTSPTSILPEAPAPQVTDTPTQTTTHTATISPSHTPTPTYTLVHTPIPPVGGFPGGGFKIKGLNIHWCRGLPWAHFGVRNIGSSSLHSLYLLYRDQDVNQTLLGPYISSAPFTASDRVCSTGGIDHLTPGNTLFVGNSLGSRGLRGHTIQATIMLCTGENLNGNCYQNIIEFVMP